MISLSEPGYQLAALIQQGTIRRPFVVGFSGIDGSGKSTQLARLDARLRQYGVEPWCGKAVLHATTSIFRLSEKLLGDPYAYHPTIPATLREFTVACDVVKHYFEVVAPRLQSAPILLLDRSVFCYRTYAQVYQADMTWIAPLYDLIPAPHVTLLLDIPVEAACARMELRQEKAAKSDEQADFLALIREGYLQRAATDPSVYRIDALRPPEAVLEQICAVLLSHIYQQDKHVFEEQASPVS